MAGRKRTSGRIERIRLDIVRAKKPRGQGETAASSPSNVGLARPFMVGLSALSIDSPYDCPSCGQSAMSLPFPS